MKDEEHSIKSKTYEYGYGDCILYRILCSCGKECGGWTTQEAEDDYKKHCKEIGKNA